MSEPATENGSGTEKVNVKVLPGTRDELRARKVGGETYEEVVSRLLQNAPEPAWKDGEGL